MSSSVVHLHRPFRNRLEVLHGHGSTPEAYFVRLEHVDQRGRHLVGEFDEAYAAFTASLPWRGRVWYLTCCEAAP
jgi:hypothetical protein